MKYMTSNEIRNMWLKFFEDKKHMILESSSLIPKDDPTLLWVNAGVAPLKKYFDGSVNPPSKRLTNVQKCIRTNDIENVGLTSRHHTFFEMLGNFSIGDYFKEDAIKYGYELLFSEKYFNFSLEKIYITYYTNDLDAKNIWLSLGIKDENLIAIEDNYWEIGEGPSGPNTEIFFDRGESFDKRGKELIKKDIENDRYIEIWNIVFSQFNAKDNLKREDYPELPNKNIDTGAGLERIASILQNTKTNFETDLFLPIIKEIEKLSGIKYNGQTEFKVISDHIKTLVFAISDGAMLSNEGRGYVLRRVLRRALKYGRNLNLNEPFLYKLIDSVNLTMKDFYPNILEAKELVSKIILTEEKQFLKTLSEGEKLFYDVIKKSNKLSGKDAFKLYDTYGFPIELTLEYALENNVEVNLDEYKNELEKQRLRSRKSRSKESSMQVQDDKFINFKDESTFVGYDKFEVKSKVIKVFKEGVILDKTPFYATSGGQIADGGYINEFLVVDVIKLINNQHLHVINNHTLKENDIVTAKIDINKRNSINKNHTATHLLHQALKDVLGNHVNQQGSLVSDELLRFDFNHFNNLSNEEIIEIEQVVKNKIKEKLNVSIKEMTLEKAKDINARALFEAKYDDLVRVVDLGYSVELCGGTHVLNTKDIKDFSIIQIESIGSGTYRIIATTDDKINNLFAKTYSHLINEINEVNEKLKQLNVNKSFKINFENNSYNDLINNNKKVLNAKKYLHDKIILEQQNETKDFIKTIDKYIPKNYSKNEIIEINNIDKKMIKEISDVLYDKMNLETLVLINKLNDENQILVKSNGKIHAGNLVREIMKFTKGKGGGRDTFAQGGFKEYKLFKDSIKEIKELL